MTLGGPKIKHRTTPILLTADILAMDTVLLLHGLGVDQQETQLFVYALPCKGDPLSRKGESAMVS
jgi:hypothetical protein